MSEWKQIQTQLKQHRASRLMRDKTDFWTDFRARARLVPQSREAGVRGPAFAPWLGAVSAAAASLVLLAGLVFMNTRRSVEGTASGVRSLDVVASYSAVVIMELTKGGANAGTLVWVANAGGGDDNGT
jgi:hypothetical protein